MACAPTSTTCAPRSRSRDEPLSTEFDGLSGRAWLKCAHQGPLPRRAADAARNPELFEALREARVDAAVRAAALRFSPHPYNGSADIGRALAALRKSR